MEKTKSYKSKIIDLVRSIDGSEKVNIPMEPIRDDEGLAESSKDIFMIFGSMTFFNDEEQFPKNNVIKNSEGKVGLEKLQNLFLQNVEKFEPLEDDIEY